MEELKFPYNYRAKVIDNDDPNQLGRIKVEVYPMLIGEETARQMRASDSDCTINGIATEQLPWATPATPILVGAGDGIGTFVVPDVDSMVWVFFEAGDINQPVYFAEALDGVMGLPSNRITNYPQRRVIRFSSDVYIIVDDSNGDVIITGAKDVIIQGDSTVHLNPLTKRE